MTYHDELDKLVVTLRACLKLIKDSANEPALQTHAIELRDNLVNQIRELIKNNGGTGV